MLKILLLLAVVGCNIFYTSTAPTYWAGTLYYPPYSFFEALNATLNSDSTANFDWVWGVDAAGRKCEPDNVDGLTWKRVGNVFTASSPSQYYSFNGTYSDDLNSISGHIIQYSNGNPVGTFNIQLNAKQTPSTCATPQPNIWPLPASYTTGTSTLIVTPSANFFQTFSTSDIIAQAIQRYMKITFPHTYRADKHNQNFDGLNVTQVVINIVDESDDYPQLETDESYKLTVNAGTGGTIIAASTVYGALRGLETFSQLVVYNFDLEMYTISGAPWNIQDSPRFPHRGLMIDVARHYQPIHSIKHVIDSLPFAKVNVLHIHMADHQSFPLQSFSAPRLWMGAFSPQERYTQEDIADVVEYARYRGVRVFVEFDMPGHASAMCPGYPQVCPSPTCTTPLNVANEQTFSLITQLLNEMTGGRPSRPRDPSPGLFKDNFIHLGGDEVDTTCWTQTPAINQWLQSMNFTADQGYGYFVDRVAKIAIAQGHRPIQWSEVFDHFQDKLAKGTIVHIWKPNTNVTQVVALGYNVLLNVGYFEHSWYLDNLDITWDAVYTNEPCVGVPDNLCPLIYGGHGEMWGETVDASDLEPTVWPKMGAIAEILWSPRGASSLAQAHSRLSNYRCLLNSRGVTAAPLNNPIARTSPPYPGSCYDQ